MTRAEEEREIESPLLERSNGVFGILEDEEDEPSVNNRIKAMKNRWQLNYQEAAIYLQEGENNERFDTHPQTQDALPAYLIVHNIWFYIIDMLASILIMGLALCEAPAVKVFEVTEYVHGSLELFGLSIIALGLGMKIRWLGWKQFFTHKRTAVKAMCLFIMYLEAIVVIIRQASHFRVTRALRPIFLIDCHFLGGVRRVLRQIFQSLPPIADMLVLLFYFLIIFSVLGFYLFAPMPGNHYFSTITESIISLFVLFTTANYPDVMMPAYHHSRWSVIFFVIFLALELYFLTNLLLAVVYDTFTGIEKNKFKKLFMHKRTGAAKAFRLLCSRKHLGKLSFTHFQGLLRYYRPSLKKYSVLLAFKTLDKSESGILSLDDFYGVYEVTKLNWKSVGNQRMWFETLLKPLDFPFRCIYRLISSNIFKFFIYLVIASNGILFFVRTILISFYKDSNDPDYIKNQLSQVMWYDWMFVAIYAAECLLKIIGLGVKGYFRSGWNVFDFVITVSAIVGVLTNIFDTDLYYVVVLRPLRLLRLFKVKKRYRDVLATAYVLLPRLWSVCIVLVIMFYFYAIIGMELFHDLPLENCCQNTSVENYYSNSTQFMEYFYLNNFNDIIYSYVTLFELMVVNNWHIIMNGVAEVRSEWSRVYFIVFYLSSMVVVTIIIAFILEAFIFRMQYKHNAENTTEQQDINTNADAVVEFEASITPTEIEKHFPDAIKDLNLMLLLQQLRTTGITTFKGYRQRTKADLNKTMYAEEMKEWIQENDRKLGQELRIFLGEQINLQSLRPSPEGRDRSDSPSHSTCMRPTTTQVTVHAHHSSIDHEQSQVI
ncbi:two pore channel protein 1-like [Antedon mediterranea]|uniref:two pore channel protein 1-like n=1 Tax=Antedon mediterranea TaxID=105859 RepID=UPI003AF75290